MAHNASNHAEISDDPGFAVANSRENVTSRSLTSSSSNGLTIKDVEHLLVLDRLREGPVCEWYPGTADTLVHSIYELRSGREYLSDDDAEWLIDQIAANGTVHTVASYDLLLRILDKAQSAPAQLYHLALTQIYLCLRDGSGPLSSLFEFHQSSIGDTVANTVRRILISGERSGHRAVSRTGLEILLSIHSCTDDLRNDPMWDSILLKSLVSFILNASSFHLPSRTDWLECPDGISELEGEELAQVLNSELKSLLNSSCANEDKNSHEGDDVELSEGDRHWLVEMVELVLAGRRIRSELVIFLQANAEIVHPDFLRLATRI